MADETTETPTPSPATGNSVSEPAPEVKQTQAAPETEQTQQTQQAPETQTPQSTPQQTEAQPNVGEPAPASEETQERVVPKPDGYKLPEGVPEFAAQVAHELDLTQKQFDGTLQFYNALSQARATVDRKNIQRQGEAHASKWGDQMKTKLSLSRRALQANDPDGKVKTFLNETGYGSHPIVLDFFYNLGKQLQEGGFLKSNIQRQPGKKSMASKLYPNHPSANS